MIASFRFSKQFSLFLYCSFQTTIFDLAYIFFLLALSILLYFIFLNDPTETKDFLIEVGTVYFILLCLSLNFIYSIADLLLKNPYLLIHDFYLALPKLHFNKILIKKVYHLPGPSPCHIDNLTSIHLYKLFINSSSSTRIRVLSRQKTALNKSQSSSKNIFHLPISYH